MSELLISDWVVELLEEWDAELPLPLDFGEEFAMSESVRVTLMTGASVAGSSVVGDGVGGVLSARLSSTYTSVKNETMFSIVSVEGTAGW